MKIRQLLLETLQIPRCHRLIKQRSQLTKCVEMKYYGKPLGKFSPAMKCHWWLGYTDWHKHTDVSVFFFAAPTGRINNRLSDKFIRFSTHKTSAYLLFYISLNKVSDIYDRSVYATYETSSFKEMNDWNTGYLGWIYIWYFNSLLLHRRFIATSYMVLQWPSSVFTISYARSEP